MLDELSAFLVGDLAVERSAQEVDGLLARRFQAGQRLQASLERLGRSRGVERLPALGEGSRALDRQLAARAALEVLGELHRQAPRKRSVEPVEQGIARFHVSAPAGCTRILGVSCRATVAASSRRALLRRDLTVPIGSSSSSASSS